MWENHLLHLEGWENDMKKWPQITFTSIFCYFIDSIGTDGEAMNNLQRSEAYQYLHSKKVGHVLLKEVGHNLMCESRHRAESEP